MTVALGAVSALALAGGAAAAVTCPASAAAVSTSGPVQWEFSVIGAPTAGASGVTSSWTRGNGAWNAGKATGTICSEDKGSFARRDLVFKVSGNSVLAPKTTRLGLLGVSLTLPVTVSASDDKGCPTATHGTVTLFASYYSVHRDSIALHFSGACATHDHTFTGAIVKVLITRNGAQVNSA
ncbi:MAG TPA: hypothetical protein VGG41_20455 [Solirubrobacteraceae bacterium]